MLITDGNLPCHKVQLPLYVNEGAQFVGVSNVTKLV